MSSRYNNKQVFLNDDERYKAMLEERGVKKIRQYAFTEMKYPTPQQINQLSIVKKTWGVGSKLYKIAHEYYGDSTLWWIIAWFNKKPTEAHFKEGDIVNVPMPLEKIYEILEL